QDIVGGIDLAVIVVVSATCARIARENRDTGVGFIAVADNLPRGVGFVRNLDPDPAIPIFARVIVFAVVIEIEPNAHVAGLVLDTDKLRAVNRRYYARCRRPAQQHIRLTVVLINESAHATDLPASVNIVAFLVIKNLSRADLCSSG